MRKREASLVILSRCGVASYNQQALCIVLSLDCMIVVLHCDENQLDIKIRRKNYITKLN